MIVRIFDNLNDSVIKSVIHHSLKHSTPTPSPLWGGNFKHQLSHIHHQADMNQDVKILQDL